MTTPTTSRREAHANVHHLRRGIEYTATTRHGTTTGEYIGRESPYGDHAILLRSSDGTASIALDDVTSIRRVA